jgi:cytoskeletal protein CcmA (bactofilin family)
LIVGETGAVKGDVDLRGVVINGKIDGDIKSKETVDIKSKGIVEGDIEADWVMIGEAAMVKGDVALRAIIINGKIEGNIKSREIVKIKSKGIVEGDIYTEKLAISEGAIFDGRSCMQKSTGADNRDVLPFERKAKSSQ